MKQYIRKKVELKCPICEKSYLKDKSEHERNNSLNRLSYCSLSCAAFNNHNHLEKFEGQGDITKFSGNKRDEFTGLRAFITRARSRKKLEGLTLEYLKTVWDKQKGKCAYTGIQLILPAKSQSSPIYGASLDRIDSTKGYMEGNVQFVSIAINFMKGQMTHEQTAELVKLIQNLGRR